MKFVTEDELRSQYNKNPYDFYQIKEGTKLTPGARQFLNDFKISFEDKTFIRKTSIKNSSKTSNFNSEFDIEGLKNFIAIELMEIANYLKVCNIKDSKELNELAKAILEENSSNEEIALEKLSLSVKISDINIYSKNSKKILKLIKFENHLVSIYNKLFEENCEDENLKSLLNNLLKIKTKVSSVLDYYLDKCEGDKNV